MKFFFFNLDNKGKLLYCFNNPFTSVINDILVKPHAKMVKILYRDESEEVFTLLDKTVELVHNVELDIEEAHFKYYVRKSMK